jgi:tetratricopeptide (TPR) repeat protein
MILMTVADAYSLTASLVEITLSSSSQHNYVRWTTKNGTTVDWDTNGQAQCLTPPGQPSFQGIAQTRQQTMAYAYRLRGSFWNSQKKYQNALNDFRQSARLDPAHPAAFNELAWIVATKDFSERATDKDEAVNAAKEAVSIQRIPNYLDTLACIYAYAGHFAQAVDIEKEASDGAPYKPEFAARLQQFQSNPPKDCSGAD